MAILRVHTLRNEKSAKTTTLRVVPYSATSLLPFENRISCAPTAFPSAPHVLAPSPSRRASKVRPNSPWTPPLPPCTPPPHRFPRRRGRVVGVDYSSIGLSETGRTRRAKIRRKRTLSTRKEGVGGRCINPRPREVEGRAQARRRLAHTSSTMFLSSATRFRRVRAPPERC